MKLIKTLGAICVLISFGCGPKSILYDRSDMEATIMVGAEVRFERKKTVKINDLVVFDYFDKRINSTLTHVLRVVGVPGDIIQFSDGDLIVNNKEYELPATHRFSWAVKLKSNMSWDALSSYSSRPLVNNVRVFFLTNSEYSKLMNNAAIDSIAKVKVDSFYIEQGIVSNGDFKFKNGSYYGPLRIPVIGDSVTSGIAAIIPLAKRIKEKSRVTENYYFVVGDNLHWCYDSRDIGLIPESLIKGIVTNYK